MSESPSPASPARERWERVTFWPLVGLGILFLVAFVVLTAVADPAPAVLLGGASVLLLTWLAFIVDVVARIALTPRGARGRWARSHLLDLLAAVLPVFRAWRVVTLVRAALGGVRRGTAVRAEAVVVATVYAALFVILLALATLSAERDAPGATITTAGDAIWWAVVTMTTVGYGDFVPVTLFGRVNAVLLMLGGIVIVGVASGTMLSYLNERVFGGRIAAPQPEAHPEDRV